VLFGVALMVVAALRVGLWVLPFRVTRGLVSVLHRIKIPGMRPGVGIIGWAVAAAAKRVPGATCLPQALAAHLLCGWSGHATTVQLGVIAGHSAGGFKAHAWVQGPEGIVIGKLADLERFTPLPEIAW
jgi:hypothetical protein